MGEPESKTYTFTSTIVKSLTMQSLHYERFRKTFVEFYTPIHTYTHDQVMGKGRIYLTVHRSGVRTLIRVSSSTLGVTPYNPGLMVHFRHINRVWGRFRFH